MTGATPSNPAPARTVDGRYVTLFSVAFEHDHFNAAGGRCHGLAVAPTPASAATMRSLGMIFRDQGSGFAVLIEQAKIGALLAWLGGRTRSDGPGRGCWAWLSFVVTADPRFLSITSLPIATDPLTQKLHVSNLQTVMPGARIALGPAEGIGAAALYPAAASRLSVATPVGGSATLVDLSGAAVTVSGGSGDGQSWFDLSALGDGFYAVTFADADGAAMAGDGTPTGVVHLPSKPGALLLLDLLIAQPLTGIGDPSGFPVSLPGNAAPGTPTVTPVSLVLPFRARETFWRYYIVSQAARGVLSDDLEIAGDGATFVKSTEELPNGDQAVVFAAQTALPLQQLSPYRFSLSGRRQAPSGGRDSISVARLPTAPTAPVWPAPSGDTMSGSSEIYVYV